VPRRPKKALTRWIACETETGVLHVSPRLVSTFLRLIEIVGDDDLCAVSVFEVIWEMLPAAEFPSVNQPAQWGTA
jgi:hypothetical protein